MRFFKRNVRLVSVKEVTSKKGRPLVFLKLADTDTYDCGEFLASNDFNPTVFEVGCNYDIALEFDGRFCSVEMLLPTDNKLN